ncbi:serine-rich adhesin for platelets [Hyalella azteca]|uniref:Serine-rich adhesin for platelets n=1 Tax=Hyalella azteca TaxID=294128 RepID=A0A8B7N0R7_HYAAZ|nr:serine-rich adhesin for platelets [Hyalella azteca]
MCYSSEHSNWMQFVRPAESVSAANCRVVERHPGHIFFITTTELPPHTELRVAYSEQYAERYNLPLPGPLAPNLLVFTGMDNKKISSISSSSAKSFDDESVSSNVHQHHNQMAAHSGASARVAAASNSVPTPNCSSSNLTTSNFTNNALLTAPEHSQVHSLFYEETSSSNSHTESVQRLQASSVANNAARQPVTQQENLTLNSHRKNLSAMPVLDVSSAAAIANQFIDTWVSDPHAAGMSFSVKHNEASQFGNSNCPMKLQYAPSNKFIQSNLSVPVHPIGASKNESTSSIWHQVSEKNSSATLPTLQSFGASVDSATNPELLQRPLPTSPISSHSVVNVSEFSNSCTDANQPTQTGDKSTNRKSIIKSKMIQDALPRPTGNSNIAEFSNSVIASAPSMDSIIKSIYGNNFTSFNISETSCDKNIDQNTQKQLKVPTSNLHAISVSRSNKPGSSSSEPVNLHASCSNSIQVPYKSPENCSELILPCTAVPFSTSSSSKRSQLYETSNPSTSRFISTTTSSSSTLLHNSAAGSSSVSGFSARTNSDKCAQILQLQRDSQGTSLPKEAELQVFDKRSFGTDPSSLSEPINTAEPVEKFSSFSNMNKAIPGFSIKDKANDFHSYSIAGPSSAYQSHGSHELEKVTCPRSGGESSRSTRPNMLRHNVSCVPPASSSSSTSSRSISSSLHMGPSTSERSRALHNASSQPAKPDILQIVPPASSSSSTSSRSISSSLHMCPSTSERSGALHNASSQPAKPDILQIVPPASDSFPNNEVESNEAFPAMLIQPCIRISSNNAIHLRALSSEDECLVSSSTEHGVEPDVDALNAHITRSLPLLDSTVDSTGDPIPLDCLDSPNSEFAPSPSTSNSPGAYEPENNLIHSVQYGSSSAIAMNSLKNIYLTPFPSKSSDLYSSSDEDDDHMSKFSSSRPFMSSINKSSAQSSLQYLYDHKKNIEPPSTGKSIEQVEDAESPGVACCDDSIGEMASSYELGLSGGLPHSSRDTLTRGSSLIHLPDQILEHGHNLSQPTTPAISA